MKHRLHNSFSGEKGLPCRGAVLFHLQAPLRSCLHLSDTSLGGNRTTLLPAINPFEQI